MFLTKLLAKVDASMDSAEPVRQERGMGRRFLLGTAVCGVAAASYGRLSRASMPRPSTAGAALPTQLPLPGIQHLDHVAVASSATEMRDWAEFRARFIQPDGRVVDSFNGGVSHTESQGLGMLFAVAFNDRATFDRVWAWTHAHLSRSSDALHSWRYEPGSANPVADTNNATDGDIYIASALVRASSRWGSLEHLRAGQAIARDILALLVRDVGGRTVLLPGASGFTASDHVVVNASYYVFPLIADLAAAYPSAVWGKLLDDGRKLVREAQFGRWRLPPDWLCVSARDGSLSLADRQPPRFSFDAVRVALFAAWDRQGAGALQRFADFWGENPAKAPAWVDLQTNACAPYATCGGVIAIARLAGHERHRQALPPIARNEDYYSAALILLSRLALRETDLRVA